MPRRSRIDAPGALHHIIVRGIDRKSIFKDDADKDNFLGRLKNILTNSTTLCFAWALIPNHFHLLLRTGSVPISTIMKRLFTGHAIYFNRKHRRVGHLFQNRYKSILCQEDAYLLELVRYIHLNPIRAKIVPDLKFLDKYAYSGHAAIMGKKKNGWQDTDYVLKFFHTKLSIARRRYRENVKKGISVGKRPDLIGGGLVRSAGGWDALKGLRRIKAYMKGDERILGDGDFVETVLKASKDEFDRKYLLKDRGYDLNAVVDRVAEVLGVNRAEVLSPGRQPRRVQARSLVCYWASRELGMSMVELSKRLKISQPTVSQSANRGEKIAKENRLNLFQSN
ncbi:transposase [Candidatus Woesebacteria bacterium]|nr:MAG: transposase [Candidatus Woesebacteria bacterium]